MLAPVKEPKTNPFREETNEEDIPKLLFIPMIEREAGESSSTTACK